MHVTTGQIFQSYDTGIAEGVPAADLVEISGTPEQVERISTAVSAKYRAERKARNKAAKRSRRTNR